MAKWLKKRVFVNFDPNNRMSEKIDPTYPVEDFTRISEKKIHFFQNCVFLELWRHKDAIVGNFHHFSGINYIPVHFGTIKTGEKMEKNNISYLVANLTRIMIEVLINS